MQLKTTRARRRCRQSLRPESSPIWDLLTNSRWKDPVLFYSIPVYSARSHACLSACLWTIVTSWWVEVSADHFDFPPEWLQVFALFRFDSFIFSLSVGSFCLKWFSIVLLFNFSFNFVVSLFFIPSRRCWSWPCRSRPWGGAVPGRWSICVFWPPWGSPPAPRSNWKPRRRRRALQRSCGVRPRPRSEECRPADGCTPRRAGSVLCCICCVAWRCDVFLKREGLQECTANSLWRESIRGATKNGKKNGVWGRVGLSIGMYWELLNLWSHDVMCTAYLLWCMHSS